MEKKCLSKKPEENKTCKPSVLKIANDLRNNKENGGVKTDLLVQKLIASLDFTEGEGMLQLYIKTQLASQIIQNGLNSIRDA